MLQSCEEEERWMPCGSGGCGDGVEVVMVDVVMVLRW